MVIISDPRALRTDRSEAHKAIAHLRRLLPSGVLAGISSSSQRMTKQSAIRLHRFLPFTRSNRVAPR